MLNTYYNIKPKTKFIFYFLLLKLFYKRKYETFLIAQLSAQVGNYCKKSVCLLKF